MTDALVVNVSRDYTQAYQVLDLVNQQRRANGLSDLSMDKGLLDAAMARAVECSYFFSHDRPDGTDCWTAFPDNKGTMGENIAMMQRTPEAVMNSWMNSPGHRSNILNGGFTTIGIGCVYVGGAGPYWVQCFGDGTAAAFAQPANTSFTTRCSIPTAWLKSGNFQFRSGGYLVKPQGTVQAEVRFINQANPAYVCELNPSTLSWSSDKASVATVSGTGLIAGKAPGTTRVNASIGSSVRISVPVQVEGTAGEWKNSGGRWWFSLGNGAYARGWAQIEGDYYYFDSNGWMQTGWQNIGGTWYYLKGSGAMATGWIYVGGAWYYLWDSGAMATGWIYVDGTWYYLHGSGAMANGWVYDGGAWYYLWDSGAMATGWVYDGGTWYYLWDSGAMATGWYQVDGCWYWSDSSGAMGSNRWVGDYYLLSSGAMATDQWIGSYHVDANGKWDQTR